MAKTRTKKARSRLRIRLSSQDHKLVDLAVERILRATHGFRCELRGPVPLPVTEEAPDGAALPRRHRRSIDFIEPPPELLASFGALDLPSGVDIEMKM